MKIDINSLKADISAERDGDWKESSLVPGLRLKVRSVNDPIFKTMRSKALRDLARDYPRSDPPEEVVAKAEGAIVAERLLLDWQNLSEDYSPDLARKLLTDPAYRRLREAVIFAATEVGQSEIVYIEDAAKN